MQKSRPKRYVATMFLIALMSVLLIVGLTACGDSEPEATPAPAATPAPEATPEPTPEPEPEAEDSVDASAGDSNLIGSWYWMGMEYYVFNADGTGTMATMDILWWSPSPGLIFICATPSICGSPSDCTAPTEWEYELVGDQLTISSLQEEGMTYTYTRG